MRYEQFLTKFDLWDHQKFSIDRIWWHLNEHHGVYYRADMGAGKTKVCIDIVNNYKRIHNVIVVCPYTAMQVWKYEFDKHSIVDKYPQAIPINVVILDDKVKQKKLNKIDNVDFSQGINVIVVNFKSIARLGLENKYWDLIIADESHRLKTHDSQITTYMAKLARFARYRIAMTGTPVGGKYEHLFGQMRFVNDKAYGNNYYSFQYKYCIFGGYKNKNIVGYHNLAHLNYIYTSWSVDVEVDHKVPVRHIEIPLKLTDKASLDAYDKKKKELTQAIIEGNDDKVRGCMTVMQQITSGYWKVNGQIVHLKINLILALSDFLESLGKNVVVYYWFKEDVRRMKEHVPKLGYEFFEINGSKNQYNEYKKYNERSNIKPSFIAVQIQSGGASLDLTDAMYGLYYSNTHRFLDFVQTQGRMVRPGQDQVAGVKFYYLITKGTIDVSQRKSNNKKEDLMNALIRGDYIA